MNTVDLIDALLDSTPEQATVLSAILPAMPRDDHYKVIRKLDALLNAAEASFEGRGE